MYDLVINAPNVRSGGGFVLLESILKYLDKTNLRCLLIANELVRKKLARINNIETHYVSHSIYARLKNELYINNIAKQAKKILFFGNVPPVFNFKCETILYVQNAYIINNYSLNGFSLKQHIRLVIERLWFKFFYDNVDRFVVQTQSMKNLLQSKIERNVELLPFSDFAYIETSSVVNVDFLYPSSGEPHKNHKNLIEAWVLLAKKGFFPELHLTLDETSHQNLLLWLNDKVTHHSLKIKNIGYLKSHSEMLCRIKYSKCLIFPSLLESFGLPLIEAEYFSTPILAPELDYVRDVVKPHQTFDAQSPVSICSAVLRFLNKEENYSILQPEQFINKVMI